jgi:hypothetical protein
MKRQILQGILPVKPTVSAAQTMRVNGTQEVHGASAPEGMVAEDVGQLDHLGANRG